MKNPTISSWQIHQLSQAAIQGMQNARTQHNLANDYRFGAAVLTRSGKVYAAGQYFSDTYTLTTHAEQNAIIHAASHGEYEIIAIAIISNKSGKQTTNPCNICKQILYENFLRSHINIKIFLLDGQGHVVKNLNLLDMISYPWPKKI